MAESLAKSQTGEKLKLWFKDKYNLGIVLTIIIALAVRIYYLVIAHGQTLWWDEAEYMATAKHWALGVPYDLNLQRPPLFQLLAAILLKLGFTSETFLKLALVVIPSVFVVFLIYVLGKEMFNKKVGLIAAFSSVFIWTFLFWSVRFQPDFFSLIFQLASLLFFWKLFKSHKKSHAIYAGFFTALAFYFKISALLIPLAVFIFVLFKDDFSFVKNKNYWIALGAFIVTLVPFSIWQYVLFGNPFAFAPSYIGGTGIGQGWEFGWMTFSYFYQLPKLLFFVLFILGLALSLFKTSLYFDIMLRNREKRLDPGVFSIIILLVITLFYIFYIRGTIEDRWVFLMIPFILYFSAIGIVFIYDKLKKYNKIIPIILLFLLFSVLIYSQLQHTDSLVTAKKSSYVPIKDASLYVKENTSPGEKVMSISYTQTTSYSERETLTYSKMSFENFTKLIEEEKPTYLLLSMWEPHHPEWLFRHGYIQDGNYAIQMDYFNSTIVISPQNQILFFDLKESIQGPGYRFDYVYPKDQFSGAFLYKITYLP